MPIDFDGTNDFLTFGATGVIRNRSIYTMTVWLNPDTIIIEHVICHILNNATAARLLANLTGSGGDLAIVTKAGDGEGGIVNTAAGFFASAGVWVHLAIVVDIAGDTVTVYKDGASFTSFTNSYTSTATSDTDSSDARIGARVTDILFYNGRVDDLRFYSRGLSAAEIQTIHASKGADGIVDGLVRMYDLDEGSDGSTASGAGSIKDATGSENIDPTNSPIYAAHERAGRRRRVA